MLLVVLMHSLPAICVKFLYQSTNVYTTQMFWFMSASFWSLILLFGKKGSRIIKDIKKHYKLLFFFATANAAGILTFFYGLIYISPGVISFLDRFGTVFQILLGVFILKEVFNQKELYGLILSMIGVVILSYSNNSKIVLTALIYLLGSLIYSFGFVMVKKNSKKISHYTFMFFRAWFMLFILTILTFVTHNYQPPSISTIPIFVIVPLFSAVIGQILQYKAFDYIGIGKSALVKNLLPFSTVILAYFILGDILNIQQIIGGIIVITGLTIMMIFRKSSIKNLSVIEDEI